MSFKRTLLSGVSVGAVAGVFASGVMFSDVAFAQKGRFLKPVSSWAVTKLDNGRGLYCTMAQQFDYNAILTVAQNRDAESTFALDFQRPILKKGKALDVILDPGAGVQRRFSVESISNQAFVARLGHDPEFFTALKKTGFLRVDVGQTSYNFDLSNIDSGRARLNECVSALQPVIEQEEIDPQGHPVISELDDENRAGMAGLSVEDANALSLQVSQLRNDNRALRTKLSAAANRVEGSPRVDAQKVLGETAAFRHLELKNTQLQEELRAVYAQQKEHGALNLAHSEVLESLRAEAQGLRQNYERLEGEHLALEQQVSKNSGQGSLLISGLQGQVEALRRERDDLSVELSALDQFLAQERGNEAQALNALSALRIENQNLRLARDEARADLAALQARYVSQERALIEVMALQNDRIEPAASELSAVSPIVDDVVTIVAMEEKVKLVQSPESIDFLVEQNSELLSEQQPELSSFVSGALDDLTPVQRQELLMKEGLACPPELVSKSEAAPILESSRFEDPFEGLNVAASQGELVEGGVPQDVSSQEVLGIPRIEDVEELAAEVSQDMPDFERVDVAPSLASSVSPALYQPAFPVQNLLAVVDPSSSVRLLEDVSGADNLVYQWRAEEVYASAEQKPLDDVSRFDDLVLDYLERTESRCPGDFAVIPDGGWEQAGMRVDRYDVACIGDAVNSSAALLFFNKAGTFTALAHETPSDHLSDAIEYRERIVSALGNGV